MKKFFSVLGGMFIALSAFNSMKAEVKPTFAPELQVTGSSSVSIVPDRITVEIGITEYYRKKGENDSVKVSLNEIDKKVVRALDKAGVPDTMIILSDIGNYYYGMPGNEFLMSKRVSVTLTDMEQLYKLSESLGFKGVTSFRISQTDNSNMEYYNRQGLKAALDKAREKAEFIAANEGLKIYQIKDVVEEGPVYYEEALATNIAMDAGNVRLAKGLSMENMRKIVRRFSVRVTYLLY